METCKRCGKGFCPSRVRRVFGSLRQGFCSPQCFSMDALAAEFKSKDDALRTMAGDIFDKLYEHGFIEDYIAISPDRFAEAVELMLPILKGEKDE